MTTLRHDIFSQPAVLRSAITSILPQMESLEAHAAQLRAGQVDRVILTAMGGSYAALFPALLDLIGGGINAVAVEASELLYDYRPMITPRTLVVAVSQSGASVEVVRLFDEALAGIPVIGVTNTPGSPLAERSTARLLIGAGEETAVSTKTYTCTLACLRLMTAALRAGEPLDSLAESLRQTADYIEAALPAWERRASELAAALEPLAFGVFMGRGVHRASALAGALVVKETAKIPTEGMVSGQFRHGPIEVLARGVTPFIFMGTGQSYNLHVQLARDLASKGTQAVCIGAGVLSDWAISAAPPPLALLPIAEIVPVQLLAAALAERRGIVPGTFYHSRKVTTTE